MDEQKLCRIINSRLTYILDVDGMFISFNGGFAADYFERLYDKMGYRVERIKED